MASNALCLASLDMIAVSHKIELVLTAGSPCQIGKPVVGGHTVEVPTFHAFWARSNECFENELVDESDVGPAHARQIHHKIALAVVGQFLDPGLDAVCSSVAPHDSSGQASHSAPRTDFVSLESWHGQPRFNRHG